MTKSGPDAAGANRLQRRKERTRAALIGAAQRLIAEGRVNVPVLEITQAADVGMGSFYNHFDSKEQLFEAAVADVLDSALLGAVDSPAPGGLTFQELSALLRTLLDGPAVGLQLTVFDPDLDPDGSQASALTDCLVSGLAGRP